MKTNPKFLLIFSIFILVSMACSILGGDNWISSVAFLPDGTLLAGGSINGKILIWDPQSGKIRKTLRQNSSIESVAFSPDGKWLASGSTDLSVTIWNTSDWSEEKIIQHEKPNTGETTHVRTVFFSPDGLYLFSLSNIYGVEILDTKNWRLVKNLGIATRGDGAISSNGEYFAVVSKDGNTVMVYDLKSFEIVFQPQFEESSWDHYGIAFSPDGTLLATQSTIRDERGRSLYEIWDISSEKVIQSWATLPFGGARLEFSPDGKILAIAQYDVSLWDIQTGQEIAHNIVGTDGTVGESILTVDFSPDGSLIAAGTLDNEYGVWDVKSGRVIWSEY